MELFDPVENVNFFSIEQSSSLPVSPTSFWPVALAIIKWKAPNFPCPAVSEQRFSRLWIPLKICSYFRSVWDNQWERRGNCNDAVIVEPWVWQLNNLHHSRDDFVSKFKSPFSKNTIIIFVVPLIASRKIENNASLCNISERQRRVLRYFWKESARIVVMSYRNVWYYSRAQTKPHFLIQYFFHYFPPGLSNICVVNARYF